MFGQWNHSFSEITQNNQNSWPHSSHYPPAPPPQPGGWQPPPPGSAPPPPPDSETNKNQPPEPPKEPLPSNDQMPPPLPSEPPPSDNAKIEHMNWQNYMVSIAKYQEDLKIWQQQQDLLLNQVDKEELEFDTQYKEWMKQYTDWKEQNKNHPNKEQYQMYEMQWKQYEDQMHEKRQMLKQRKDQLLQAKQYALGQQPQPPIPQASFSENTMPFPPANPQTNQYHNNFTMEAQHDNFQVPSKPWNMGNIQDADYNDKRQNPYIFSQNEFAEHPLLNNFHQNQLPKTGVDPAYRFQPQELYNPSISSSNNFLGQPNSNIFETQTFSNNQYPTRFHTDVNSHQQHHNLNRQYDQSNARFLLGPNNQSNIVEYDMRNSLPMPTDIINKYANVGSGRIIHNQSEQIQSNRFQPNQFNKLTSDLNNRIGFNHDNNFLSNENKKFQPDSRFTSDQDNNFHPNQRHRFPNINGNNRFPLDDGNNLPDLGNRFSHPGSYGQNMNSMFTSQLLSENRFHCMTPQNSENNFGARFPHNQLNPRLPLDHENMNNSYQNQHNNRFSNNQANPYYNIQENRFENKYNDLPSPQFSSENDNAFLNHDRSNNIPTNILYGNNIPRPPLVSVKAFLSERENMFGHDPRKPFLLDNDNLMVNIGNRFPIDNLGKFQNNQIRLSMNNNTSNMSFKDQRYLNKSHSKSIQSHPESTSPSRSNKVFIDANEPFSGNKNIFPPENLISENDTFNALHKEEKGNKSVDYIESLNLKLMQGNEQNDKAHEIIEDNKDKDINLQRDISENENVHQDALFPITKDNNIGNKSRYSEATEVKKFKLDTENVSFGNSRSNEIKLYGQNNPRPMLGLRNSNPRLSSQQNLNSTDSYKKPISLMNITIDPRFINPKLKIDAAMDIMEDQDMRQKTSLLQNPIQEDLNNISDCSNQPKSVQIPKFSERDLDLIKMAAEELKQLQNKKNINSDDEQRGPNLFPIANQLNNNEPNFNEIKPNINIDNFSANDERDNLVNNNIMATPILQEKYLPRTGYFQRNAGDFQNNFPRPGFNKRSFGSMNRIPFNQEMNFQNFGKGFTPQNTPYTVIEYGHSGALDEQNTDLDWRQRWKRPEENKMEPKKLNDLKIGPEKIPIENLLNPSKPTDRPERIVVILRGLPGSGKSHIAKLIKEKETLSGRQAPRLLCLDDYFMTEAEKITTDPDTGKKFKKMSLVYEYDSSLEPSYKASFLRNFKRQIDDAFFTFIIVDAIFNDRKFLDDFCSYAKTKAFQVFIVEVTCDIETCAKRNEHKRTLDDIKKLHETWSILPLGYTLLDVSSILKEEDVITEVVMEDATPAAVIEDEEDKDAENASGYKSKWEISEASEEKLDKLDGIKADSSKHILTHNRLEDYLQLPDDYETRQSEPGKKRVRWADIEERKDQIKKRELGFVIGQTDWAKITDDDYADKALNRTKYF